jgi:hypothetical protein
MIAELKSTADLRRVQTQMRRREVTLRFEDSVLHVTHIGGIYRARLSGKNVVAFGENPSEAEQRLRKLEQMRSVFIAKHCDALADRKEQRTERAVSKFVKSVKRFAPKRG